tara:strand:- start:235 stop:921 length:687 start_codon:yes stop_codon:yes gene_type:complete
MEYILLAGGRGTRLSNVVNDRPKPLALINGKPFITIILDKIINYSCEKIFITVSFKGDMFEKCLGNNYKGIPLIYIHEKTPLGTGGAVLNAFRFLSNEKAIIINADTFLDLNYSKFIQYAIDKDFSLCATKVENSERYGLLNISNDSKVLEFLEKQKICTGYINSGVYMFSKSIIDLFKEIKYCSLETKILKDLSDQKKLFAFTCDSFFIDIGVPKDYFYAQTYFNQC